MPTINDSLDPVVRAVGEYKSEAQNARVDRLARNRRNRAVLNDDMDYSSKIQGQSKHHLPKLAVALQAFVAVIKQGLSAENNWFSVEAPLRSPIDNYQIRELLMCFLRNLHAPGKKSKNFTTVITDAVTAAATDALMIVKIQGSVKETEEFFAERGQPWLDEFGRPQPGEVTLSKRNRSSWRLAVDLVADVDYYPDPTGEGLYEIHSVVRELSQVVENPLYDANVLEKMYNDMAAAASMADGQAASAESQREDDEHMGGHFAKGRKRVRVDEFWGTMLDQQGNVLHNNVVAAVANGKYLIRPPVANPFWHKESPFVVSPLVRKPGDVWHKSVYDEPTLLNEAIDELYNLIYDGGLASVWGVRQVRRGLLENPDEVSAGIPAHKTLAIKDETPDGTRVVEQVTQGQIPQDAFQLFAMIDREFQQAAMVNDVRLGNLPPRRVKATEIIESQSSQSVTIDAILKDVENEFIEPLLRKSWLTVLQFADAIPFDHYEGAVPADIATTFQQMPSVDKYIYYGQRCSFQVFGLSQALNRIKEFQSLVTILQVVGGNPVLLQAFVQRYSPFKILESLFELMEVKPSRYELTIEEQAQLPAFIEGLPIFAQLAQQGGGAPGGSVGNTAPQGASQALNNPSVNLPQG